MLEIMIKRVEEMSALENIEAGETSHLAFAGEDTNDDIEWSSAEWVVLCRFEGKIVATLGMVAREVQVGDTLVLLAGIGGVATHPEYQRRGFGGQMMQRAAMFMRDEIQVTFGLLVCSTHRVPYYQKFGWQEIKEPMYFDCRGEKQMWKEHTMIIPLADQAWPKGSVDLRGKPW